MIKVCVNGNWKTIDPTISLSNALSQWDYKITDIAVAVNNIFVPRSSYDSRSLSNNDSIEILTPMQGG